jgi:hypothetical protein
LPPALEVFRFGHPGVFSPNVLCISLIFGLVGTQDGEIGVQQHLGVNVFTGIVFSGTSNTVVTPLPRRPAVSLSTLAVSGFFGVSDGRGTSAVS